jgi:hypothetical protein
MLIDATRGLKMGSQSLVLRPVTRSILIIQVVHVGNFLLMMIQTGEVFSLIRNIARDDPRRFPVAVEELHRRMSPPRNKQRQKKP